MAFEPSRYSSKPQPKVELCNSFRVLTTLSDCSNETDCGLVMIVRFIFKSRLSVSALLFNSSNLLFLRIIDTTLTASRVPAFSFVYFSQSPPRAPLSLSQVFFHFDLGVFFAMFPWRKILEKWNWFGSFFVKIFKLGSRRYLFQHLKHVSIFLVSVCT